MAQIQLLSGPAVDDALETTAVRHLFRYQLNPATIGVLLILGGLCFVSAGVLWFFVGLGGLTTALFIGSILMGMTFLSMGSFWSNFKQKRFIAISDDFLFVGKDEQAWRIHWSLVDRESLNLDEMQTSKLSGKLELKTAGQDVEIPLYTPFVFIEDIEGLMFELLQRLDTEGGEAPVGAPGQDVDLQEVIDDDSDDDQDPDDDDDRSP